MVMGGTPEGEPRAPPRLHPDEFPVESLQPFKNMHLQDIPVGGQVVERGHPRRGGVARCRRYHL